MPCLFGHNIFCMATQSFNRKQPRTHWIMLFQILVLSLW